MSKTDKSFHEVSTQCQTSTDEQTQVSQSNQSKDTQTCSIYPSVSVKHHHHRRRIIPSNDHSFINPYSIIDRVNQSEEFLKFLHKQNLKLDFLYTNFLKNLQKYNDQFLLALQQEHSLYGIYRRDMIRYLLILQNQINDLRTKVNILQESNKNFALFQKHFQKLIQNKSPLEDFLTRHHRYQKEPMKYQQQFFEIYHSSSVQLRTIEQQRLLAIREQMRFAINLTLFSSREHHLFTSNNFDDILNMWEHQNTVSIDHWTHFPHRSPHQTSLSLHEEYYHHEQINEEFLQRLDSMTSNMTHSHI